MVKPENEGKNVIMNTLLIAGGSAAANFFAELLCYPLDTVNTWIKTSYSQTTIRSLIQKNVQTEGLSVFYRGVNTQAFVSLVPSFIYFSAYEMLNRVARKFCDRMNWEKQVRYIPTVTSGLSECFSLLLMVPMDALKTRLQLNSPEYRYASISKGLKEMIKREGYVRLFKASPLYIFHAIIFNITLFQSYELFRIRMMEVEKKTNEQLTLLDCVQNTICATAIAMAFTNPLDLVITRYQVVDSSVGKLSLKKIVKEIVKKDGWTGLNRGVVFRTLHGCLEACILLPVYEELRKKYGEDFAHN